jgi:uncharacterized protein (TIGR02217 family)
MSNAIFPTFPGLAWSVYKAPEWSTSIQRAVSGKEVRRADRARPIWQFSMSYEFLRGGNLFTEYQRLLAFYNARQGSFDSFLLSDPSDSATTAQPIGIGNGVSRTFQLVHAIDTWTEPVGYAPAPTVLLNGVATSAFTSDGVSVTLTTAPAAGVVITWTGAFYYRVRFAKDTMEFEQFMKDFWLLKKCDLVGVI